eukprot:634922-Pyramimonas_sp.AAC.1
MSTRAVEHVVVLWTHSHMNARDIVAGTCFRSLAIGNLIADEFAGYAANRVRVPESIRTRVLLHERR